MDIGNQFTLPGIKSINNTGPGSVGEAYYSTDDENWTKDDVLFFSVKGFITAGVP